MKTWGGRAKYQCARTRRVAALRTRREHEGGRDGVVVASCRRLGNAPPVSYELGMDYVPKGNSRVSPYVHATDVKRLIAFLEETVGGKEVMRLALPDGQVVHAEVRLGDSTIMMGHPSEERRMRSQIHVSVEDCDAAYARALAFGATSVGPPQDMFYGDRVASVKDVSGNEWFFATHKEDVP